MKIDGNKIAGDIIEELKTRETPDKFLAVFCMAENKRSYGFVKKKEEAAEKLGVDFRIFDLPDKVDDREAGDMIEKVANRNKCGGALVQLPLPDHLDPSRITDVIPAEKDVDLLGERALGMFYNNRSPVLPPAVGVVREILKIFNIQYPRLRRGFGGQAISNIAIVGPGFLVGKPVAVWFMGRAEEMVIMDQGSDLSLLGGADLVISGVGKPGIIQPDNLKEGAGVIDFGYGRDEEGSLFGDLDPASSLSSLSFYTPTPGGTGPILVAKLFENFYRLNS